MKNIREEFNKKIRPNFIKNHPFCQYCNQPATQVHHLIPIAKGGDNREGNLIPLCDNCHSLIEGKHFDKAWKEAQRAGIERAKKEGKFKGGHALEIPEAFHFYYKKLNTLTKGYIAEQLHISRPTLNKWIKMKEEGLI